MTKYKNCCLKCCRACSKETCFYYWNDTGKFNGVSFVMSPFLSLWLLESSLLSVFHSFALCSLYRFLIEVTLLWMNIFVIFFCSLGWLLNFFSFFLEWDFVDLMSPEFKIRFFTISSCSFLRKFLSDDDDTRAWIKSSRAKQESINCLLNYRAHPTSIIKANIFITITRSWGKIYYSSLSRFKWFISKKNPLLAGA